MILHNALPEARSHFWKRTIAVELNDDFLGLTLAKEFLLPGHLKITTTGVPK
jgi:hypothetical protein